MGKVKPLMGFKVGGTWSDFFLGKSLGCGSSVDREEDGQCRPTYDGPRLGAGDQRVGHYHGLD